jgi:hypothetical protein
MDNFFTSCPPKMNDQGRHLSDFKTSTAKNEYIKYINNIWRDDQYRLFLQQNGKQILDNEFAYYKNNASCWTNDCVHNYPLRQNNRQMAQERAAYDSIQDPRTHSALASQRVCTQYKDYRLNPLY